MHIILLFLLICIAFFVNVALPIAFIVWFISDITVKDIMISAVKWSLLASIVITILVAMSLYL